jgi:hypothetical protein
MTIDRVTSDRVTSDRALIGHTGFVGSNLRHQRTFGACFNSTTIGEIDGRSFDDVVCAGVSAVKWWANQNPVEDRSRIEGLMRHLETIRTRNFTLISTVDVYDPPLRVTERDLPDLERSHPYGRNRAVLERFVAERFPTHQIVRLPALFGAGLKKNVIYDLMHDNRLAVINPASSFQWYPLGRLAADLDLARRQGLSVLNLATEPVGTEAIRSRFFPGSVIGTEPAPEAHYDLRTIHDARFGGGNGFIMDGEAVLAAIGRFIESERAG